MTCIHSVTKQQANRVFKVGSNYAAAGKNSGEVGSSSQKDDSAGMAAGAAALAVKGVYSGGKQRASSGGKRGKTEEGSFFGWTTIILVSFVGCFGAARFFGAWKKCCGSSDDSSYQGFEGGKQNIGAYVPPVPYGSRTYDDDL